MIDQLQIQEFMKFFSGSMHNFGEFIYSENKKNGKLEGTASTKKNRLVTVTDYQSHLEGKKGLGIIPINENQKCRFSVIDVDVYDMNLNIYIEAIERNSFPLVPFRSKSGGLHIYLFLKEEVSVRNVIESMRKMSFLLSLDMLMRINKKRTLEIYPKQIKIANDEFGSWINLPYYNCEKTTQYAIKKGKRLSLADALIYIKNKEITLSDLNFFLKDLPYNDAPPCLQTLFILNPFEENSGRNNYLFSFGVYLKKKDESFFEQNLYEVNKSISEPIGDKELDHTIIKSIQKRDYMYKCKESPCVDYCNKNMCKKREFGIGKNEGYFSSVECGQLYQYKTHQPYYEWEVKIQGQDEFKRLRFQSEEEVIKQDMFLRLCMRELHEIPSKLKQGEWFNKLNQALKEIRVISVDSDDDTSPMILLKNLVLDFLTGRAKAETKDQILAKRVYFDKTGEEYFFRVKDLTEFLYVQKSFKYFSPTELHGILREFDCTYKKLTTESRRQVRVAALSKEKLNMYDNTDIFTPDFSNYSDGGF